jgi:hypothetical protein
MSLMRRKLPNRRPQITSKVQYIDVYASGRPLEIEISFGLDESRTIKECFISSKSHPLTPLLNDVCILISRLLQHGDTIESLAEGLGENRLMDESAFGHAAPASFIGAIVRQGTAVQHDINTERSR